jgi:hypothetical protein
MVSVITSNASYCSINNSGVCTTTYVWTSLCNIGTNWTVITSVIGIKNEWVVTNLALNVVGTFLAVWDRIGAFGAFSTINKVTILTSVA